MMSGYFYLIKRYVVSGIAMLALLIVCVTTAYPKERVDTDETNAVIHVNAAKKIRTIDKSLFGVSMGKLYRAQWKKPADLDDENLINILNELAPGFINIQNTMLGLPFYPESTGKYSKRQSFKKTLERLGINKEALGKEIYKKVKGDRHYNKPPNKNYDDVLKFFLRLNKKTGVSIRVPTIFTTLLKPDSYGGLDIAKLKLNLDPKTGADLVHYLNDPETTELGALRAKNGHPEPYNVKHFVLGNEMWVNYDKGLSIDQIASQHIAFYKAMKEADPTIMIGFNLLNDAYPHRYFKDGTTEKYKKLLEYNESVLNPIKDHVDYVTFHDYGYGVKSEGANIDILNDDEWRYVMAFNHIKEDYGQSDMQRDIIKKHNGKAKVVIDEFSGPVGSLGGAIYIADYIIYMINSGYEIFFGYWTLGIMEPHTKWGLIRVSEDSNHPLVKRPNYYAVKMFTNYFGDEVINTDITSPTYDTKPVKWVSFLDWPYESNIPVLNAIGSTEGDKLFLMVINRDIERDIKASVNINGFEPESIAKVYTLSGPSMNASNEENPYNVKIFKSSIEDASTSFDHTFKKHSVTVIKFSAR
jgi:alpha-N-arabinofuranosidase